jgi:hypothetical protein
MQSRDPWFVVLNAFPTLSCILLKWKHGWDTQSNFYLVNLELEMSSVIPDCQLLSSTIFLVWPGRRGFRWGQAYNRVQIFLRQEAPTQTDDKGRQLNIAQIVSSTLCWWEGKLQEGRKCAKSILDCISQQFVRQLFTQFCR